MHICIVSPVEINNRESWGGIHTHTEMLCKILVKLGHSVTLIVPSYSETVGVQLYQGIHIITINESQSKVANCMWLRKEIQSFLSLHNQNSFDCIFSEGNAGYELMKEKSIAKLPFFYFIHVPSFMHFYNNWKEVCNLRIFISYLLKTVPKILHRILFWEIPLAHFSTKVLCVSVLKAKQLCKFYKVSPEKVEVINNWVDINFFTPDDDKKSCGRKRFLISENTLVFLGVGGLWRPKGFHIAIQSFSRIVCRIPNSVLLICGSGKEEQKLIRLVKKKRLENKVRFLGKISHSELPLIYNMADIFLIPSLMSEGQPYTLIEAMACGLPVIASKKGGNIETLGDAGILVPAGKVNAWIDAMLELAEDSEKRKIFSKKARERVLNFFSEEVAIKRFQKLLEKYNNKV
ncbi:MAG: glycosyltransferase family 4 protein, partial [Candidatus Njordarchaeales archaeon]